MEQRETKNKQTEMMVAVVVAAIMAVSGIDNNGLNIDFYEHLVLRSVLHQCQSCWNWLSQFDLNLYLNCLN